jgi:DNA-directed RNA polymerase specialized sigma24 family protein
VLSVTAFLTMWRRIDEVPEGDAALVWLYGVAYRVIGHQWRSVKRRSRLRS